MILSGEGLFHCLYSFVLHAPKSQTAFQPSTAHQSPESGVSDAFRDRYLRSIFQLNSSKKLKQKSLAVAESFRYCKGFLSFINFSAYLVRSIKEDYCKLFCQKSLLLQMRNGKSAK